MVKLLNLEQNKPPYNLNLRTLVNDDSFLQGSNRLCFICYDKNHISKRSNYYTIYCPFEAPKLSTTPTITIKDVTANTSSFSINWENPTRDDYTGMTIKYRKINDPDDEAHTKSISLDKTKTTYIPSDTLENDTLYTFTFTTKDCWGHTLKAASIEQPAAPKKVTTANPARSFKENGVMFKCSKDDSDYADTYRVYYKKHNATEWKNPVDIPLSETTVPADHIVQFDVLLPEAGATYDFKLCAVRGGVEGVVTNIAFDSTPERYEPGTIEVKNSNNMPSITMIKKSLKLSKKPNCSKTYVYIQTGFTSKLEFDWKDNTTITKEFSVPRSDTFDFKIENYSESDEGSATSSYSECYYSYKDNAISVVE